MCDDSAYHEAGHAVAAIALGGWVGHVTITPDRDDGPDRHGDIEVRWPRGRFTPLELASRTIQVALAGPAAEMIHRGEPFHPAFIAEWSADWKMAWETAVAVHAHQRRRLKYLEQITVELYRWMNRDDVWAAVAAVVDELLAHETLEAEQVNEIVAYWLA